MATSTQTASKRLASPAVYKRVCGDGWEELRDADKAVRAYRRKIGDEAFREERERLHYAFTTTAKRMKLGEDGYAHPAVARAVNRKHRNADNWGLLVLVYSERLAAQQAFDEAFPKNKSRKAA